MTPSEIKFNTIKLINGIKYMSKSQVDQCKTYIRNKLNLNDTDENNKVIEDAIRTYFAIL